MALAITLVVLAGGSLWSYRVGYAYLRERNEFAVRAMPDDTAAARTKVAGLREVSWKLEGGASQYAWYVPSRNGALIVYLHGSPGSRGSMLSEAAALAARGYGGLLLDLPGYGKSEGPRDWGEGFRESVRRAIDFAAAQPEIDPGRIAGFGYSMSTAILAHVAAADVRVRSLVLVAPFTRLEDQLRHQFRSRVPGTAGAAVLAARHSGVAVDALDTLEAVRRLDARPLLLIAGEIDTAVPPSMASLLQRAVPRAQLYLAPDVGHAGFHQRLGSGYIDRLAGFFAGSLSAGGVAEREPVHMY
jgi:pimeloyl-ACP methyl ester carboxylesterase